MRTTDKQVSLSVSDRIVPSSSGKAWKPVDTCRDDRSSSSSSSTGGLNNLTASPKRAREKVMEVASPPAGGRFFSWARGDSRQMVDDYPAAPGGVGLGELSCEERQGAMAADVSQAQLQWSIGSTERSAAHHGAGNAQCENMFLEGPGDTDTAGRGGAMLFKDLPQGIVVVGATVAVTMYAVYRLGARRKWWSLVHFRLGGRGDGDKNVSCGGVNTEIKRGKGGRDSIRKGGSVRDVCNDDRSAVAVLADGERRRSNGSDSSPGEGASAVLTNSRTEDILAEADALIGAYPPEPPVHDRRISNDEIDALVDLTHRVLARDPSAISEIADDAASVGDLSDVGSPRNSAGCWDDAASSDSATSRTPCEHNHASAGRACESTLR